MTVSVELIRSLLREEAGRLFWIVARSNRIRVGDQAGSLGFNGYWYVNVGGHRLLVHRVVWLLRTGAWPESNLDHIDGDIWNNRFDNLRLASASQNGANSRTPVTNRSGAKGVSWNARLGKWHAYIGVRRKRLHLGFFEDFDAASAAYRTAAIKHHGEFARAA